MTGQSPSASPGATWFAAAVVTLAAFLLYLYTLAPGLTWSHFGADGGELIAAAMTNGVPHPPGYPLYIMLLQGWLSLGKLLFPSANLAWIGNLFSAFCGALSGGTTVFVLTHLIHRASAHLPENVNSTSNLAWIWAMLVGLAWASAPLLWEQAVITEVYALHALLIALLGWAMLVQEGRPFWLVLPVALGVAHHLTYLLLLPGVLYWLWSSYRTSSSHPSSPHLGLFSHQSLADLFRAGLWLLIGLLLGMLFYVRIPLAAQSGSPINWGYADNWDGFWWLTSASAYRSYLFSVPATSVFERIAAWAYQLTAQFTALGLAFALLGLSSLGSRRASAAELGPALAAPY